MTQAIAEIAKPLGISVHDHIIVARGTAREPEEAAADLICAARISAAIDVTPGRAQPFR